jgi:hypothetical protein
MVQEREKRRGKRKRERKGKKREKGAGERKTCSGCEASAVVHTETLLPLVEMMTSLWLLWGFHLAA